MFNTLFVTLLGNKRGSLKVKKIVLLVNISCARSATKLNSFQGDKIKWFQVGFSESSSNSDTCFSPFPAETGVKEGGKKEGVEGEKWREKKNDNVYKGFPLKKKPYHNGRLYTQPHMHAFVPHGSMKVSFIDNHTN